MLYTLSDGVYSDTPSSTVNLSYYPDGSTRRFNETLLYTQATPSGDIIILVARSSLNLFTYTATAIADFRAHEQAVAILQQERTV